MNDTITSTTASDTVDSSENVTHSMQLVDQPILLLVTANIGSIFDSVSTTYTLRHMFVQSSSMSRRRV